MAITLKTTIGIVSLAGLLIGNTAFAQGLILNPDFSTGDLTGWTTSGVTSGATITVNLTGGNPADYALFDNTALNNELILSQATAAGSVVGAGFTVNFSFDTISSGAPSAGASQSFSIIDEDSSNNALATSKINIPSARGWTTYTGSITTVTGSDHLFVEFISDTTATSGSLDHFGIDNVVVVPEPASVSLAAMGLLGLWTFRRSRKA